MRQLIAALTLIAATTSAAFAQDEADVDGVRAAVMAYFNAGNTGDPDLAREAFYTSTGDMFIYRNDEDGEFEGAEVGTSYDRVPFHMIANDGNIMEHAIPFDGTMDLDADGDRDLVLPGKSGLWVLRRR